MDNFMMTDFGYCEVYFNKSFDDLRLKNCIIISVYIYTYMYKVQSNPRACMWTSVQRENPLNSTGSDFTVGNGSRSRYIPGLSLDTGKFKRICILYIYVYVYINASKRA